MTLVLDDIHVSYKVPGRGVMHAVQGVSLELEPGRTLGLVGESGCGKSTIARAICGLNPLAGGEILLNGEPIKKLGLRRRSENEQRIQMVFQNPYASLNPRRTIRSQIEDGLRVGGTRGSWTVNELLERVELDASVASRFPHQFSGGQRQRIAIARAIATVPDVLIGDEPIASLDASLQAKVAQLMKDLAAETGASLLFISHDLAVVRLIADEVAVMNSGRIVERGETERVWSQPGEDYTKRLLSAIPVVDGLGTLPGIDGEP